MARTSYHDFLDVARAEFDLSYAEAQDLYRETRDMLDRPATAGDFYDIYAVEPEDRGYEYDETPDAGWAYEVGWDYDLDEFFDDVTDWDMEVDEGFEFEITATYESD